ncbi:hypothetical protein [Staphylococcus equorum]|uniref:hypothetical protein n=1 Tax=Staphylococcus equorum TaxID=246432 RepID=UPI0008074A09|nr:hypothetical protein [Staphylococcus equorum]ANR69363.1 hypothetical protein AWC34_12595 [Staphylococcus equorum]
MKKLISTITIIAILGILAAVGIFGYNKYQEVELEKSELQAKQKQLTSDSSTQKDSDLQVQNESKSANETANENNTMPNEKVDSNNVFDYLFAGME